MTGTKESASLSVLNGTLSLGVPRRSATVVYAAGPLRLRTFSSDQQREVASNSELISNN